MQWVWLLVAMFAEAVLLISVVGRALYSAGFRDGWVHGGLWSIAATKEFRAEVVALVVKKQAPPWWPKEDLDKYGADK